MSLTIFCIIWYVVGVIGGSICTYFDWKEHQQDITVAVIIACILSGIGGPLMLIGAMIYTSSGIVLIKGKNK